LNVSAYLACTVAIGLSALARAATIEVTSAGSGDFVSSPKAVVLLASDGGNLAAASLERLALARAVDAGVKDNDNFL
jgi:hypothetical protein